MLKIYTEKYPCDSITITFQDAFIPLFKLNIRKYTSSRVKLLWSSAPCVQTRARKHNSIEISWSLRTDFEFSLNRVLYTGTERFIIFTSARNKIELYNIVSLIKLKLFSFFENSFRPVIQMHDLYSIWNRIFFSNSTDFKQFQSIGDNFERLVSHAMQQPQRNRYDVTFSLLRLQKCPNICV